jgi:ATP-binding cassette subfamily B protein/subfamily B ATP-binding cassette protein MsbA
MIAEEGHNLSGGEKQLIAIGRMIVYRPRYVILDEATSSIDRYLDEKVRDIIDGEFRTATRLVIAHRISTMVDMDRIIVIHDGELAEEGNHEELLEKKGLYDHLYSIYKSGGRL